MGFMMTLRNLLLMVIIICIDGTVSSEDKTGLKVLAFGGNGFIGSEALIKLFEDPDHYYNVTLVSRGNWYWDSETRIKPKVAKHIICDREESDLEYCTHLVNYMKDNPKIDVILDFSAWHGKSILMTLELLKQNRNEVGVYVYVSSDSIYGICKNSRIPGLAEEVDDKRLEMNEEEFNDLTEGYSYAHEKLRGEEILRGPEQKYPYVIFRLPDTLGPRDNTNRWWKYQMWIQFYKFIKVPLIVPELNRKLQTSYLYVKDVAEAIHLAIHKPETWNTVYNLGLEESLTLHQFLSKMAMALGEKVDFEFIGGDLHESKFPFFPSVSMGAVSIEKAQNVLGFKPHTWNEVFAETVPFYKEAFYKFPLERFEVVYNLTQKVIPPSQRQADFFDMIDDLADNPNKSVDEYLTTPEPLLQEMTKKTMDEL